MVTRLVAFLRRVPTFLMRENAVDLVLRLTVVLVLVHAGTSVLQSVLLRMECLLLLVFPALLRNRNAWWLLTGTLLVGNASNWSTIDNHQYLIAYWVLACALSLSSLDPGKFLSLTSRRLIAAVFVLAVGWKLYAGEFLDGSFFYWTALMDYRLSGLGSWLTNQPEPRLMANAEALRLFAGRGEPGLTLPIDLHTALARVALAMSWFGLLLEAAVGIVHIREAPSLYRWRQVLLGMFLVSTYFLLPVVGFAFTLAVLGLASCDDRDCRGRAAFVGVLVVIQLVVLPWQQLLIPA